MHRESAAAWLRSRPGGACLAGHRVEQGRGLQCRACVAQRGLLDALEAGDSVAATEAMDEYLRGLFARMRFLPPPTTDLRKAFGMSARRQDKRQEA